MNIIQLVEHKHITFDSTKMVQNSIILMEVHSRFNLQKHSMICTLFIIFNIHYIFKWLSSFLVVFALLVEHYVLSYMGFLLFTYIRLKERKYTPNIICCSSFSSNFFFFLEADRPKFFRKY